MSDVLLIPCSHLWLSGDIDIFLSSPDILSRSLNLVERDRQSQIGRLNAHLLLLKAALQTYGDIISQASSPQYTSFHY